MRTMRKVALAAVCLMAALMCGCGDATPLERQIEQLKTQNEELRAAKDEEIAALKARLEESEALRRESLSEADSLAKALNGKLEQSQGELLATQGEVHRLKAELEKALQGKTDGIRMSWLACVIVSLILLGVGMFLGAQARQQLKQQSAPEAGRTEGEEGGHDA